MKKSWKILTVILISAFCAGAVFLAWYYSPASRAGRLTRLGIEAGKSAQIEKALEYFEEAVRIAPGHFLARFNLGEIYAALDRTEKAMEEFRAADALRPRDALTLYELARLSARIGKKAEALSYLEKAIDAGFNDIPRLNSDEDFAQVRGEAQFKELFGRWEAQTGKKDAGTRK